MRGGGVGISLRLSLFIRGKEEAGSERGVDGGKAKQAVGIERNLQLGLACYQIGLLIQ